jgi:simple sugar transport system ATP-binding protein
VAGEFADIARRARGEVLGITGLLDSGRNELALALAGVRPADRGEMQGSTARRRGVDQPGRRDRARHRLRAGRSAEPRPVPRPLDPRQHHHRGARPAARPASARWTRAARRAAERTVAELKIATPDVERPVQSLSGGNQQRVLIGRWLAIKPRVLILHGPTVGVDVGSKDTIYRIVQTLAEKGLGVILVSDDLPELLQNCHRILLMRKGRIARDFEAGGLAEDTLYRALVSENDADASATRTPATRPIVTTP